MDGRARRRPPQHPRQIDCTILETSLSWRSTTGLPVPSAGPLMAAPLPPDEESAVPAELVPGAAGLVPNAPPVSTKWCDPTPPPRLYPAVERPRESATESPRPKICNFFIDFFMASLASIARWQRPICSKGSAAHGFLSGAGNARIALGGCSCRVFGGCFKRSRRKYGCEFSA